LTSHEDEDITGRLRNVNLEDLVDGAVNVVFAWCFGEEDIYWEGSAGDLELRCATVERGEAFCVHCCGSDDEFNVLTSGKEFLE
jgi:hypothetical protein